MKRVTLLVTQIVAMIVLSLSAQAAQWRLGHVYPPTHPASIALKEATDEIRNKTQGRIDIRVFPASQIGASKEILTGMTIGTHQMALDGAGILSQWTKEIGVFEAPFLARDFSHLERMASSDVGQKIFEKMRQDHGFRVLDIWYYGTRHLTNSRRPVQTVADLTDMKVRVPEVALSLSFMKALGAAPTPMAFPELYLGLQTGVVDGQENPLPTINAAKFYEVQDHLALSGHLVQLIALVVSEQAWNAVSDADRAVVVETFTRVGDAHNKSVSDLEAGLIKTLTEKGMKVTRPDRAAMKAAMAPVYAEFDSVWGKGTFDAMAAIQ